MREAAATVCALTAKRRPSRLKYLARGRTWYEAVAMGWAELPTKTVKLSCSPALKGSSGGSGLPSAGFVLGGSFRGGVVMTVVGGGAVGSVWLTNSEPASSARISPERCRAVSR